MKGAWAAVVAWAVLGVSALGAAGFEEIQDGPALVARLRALVPAEETARAVLRIRRAALPTLSISLLITTRVETASAAGKGAVWSTSYRSVAAPGFPAEFLKVVHRPDEPNLYYYARGQAGQEAVPEARALSGAEAGIPFAGSDFFLLDLGFEFFYWPEQKIVNRQMRKSRSCKVLESRPDPKSKSVYSRVLSWIDNETGGIVLAEAYDDAGKRLKEFEVKSLRKVEDAYQIQELLMENVREHSRTLLEFEQP